MPFTPPTLDDVRDRMAAVAATKTFRTRAGQVTTPGPLRPESVLAILVDLMATATHGAHRHVAAAMDDATPVTATGEGLDHWGVTVGVTRKPASFAKGPVDFTGTDGSSVPAGTKVQHVPSGQVYSTTASGIVAGGSVTLQVEADVTGPDANLADGTTVQLVQPVAGIDTDATTSERLAGGADAETDEDLRARIILETSSRPNGANAATYVSAALTVPGITRAWAKGDTGSAGHVLVYAVADDLSPITPPPTMLADVAAALDPPVATTPVVAAPGLVSLDPVVALKPNVLTVQENVAASLEAMLAEVTAPGATIPLTKVNQAISNAVGEEDHLVSTLVGLPAADVTVAAGEIVVLGTPIWGTLP